MKIPDDIWLMMQDYYDQYFGMQLGADERENIENVCEVRPFNGGAFITLNEEFDLFVIPEMRGKWRIRTIFTNFINEMVARYGRVVATIHPCNYPSLRLAKGFGFKQIDVRGNGMLILEKA